MFNIGVVELLVILAFLGLVVGGAYRFIGWVVHRELRKHEGT